MQHYRGSVYFISQARIEIILSRQLLVEKPRYFRHNLVFEQLVIIDLDNCGQAIQANFPKHIWAASTENYHKMCIWPFCYM